MNVDNILKIFLNNNMLDSYIKDGEMHYTMKEEFANKTSEEIEEILNNLKK